MKHWELVIEGEHIRAEWNEAATFNMQRRDFVGNWVDYHCFTVYGIESEQEALECVMEMIQEETERDDKRSEGLELWLMEKV